jgi:SAM-dependent methyltransferase
MESVDLYDNVYGDFGSEAEHAVRREAYGEDLGQSSWLTAAEWLGFADLLEIGPGSEVLEVGSGSGGPAVYLAAARGCRITGVDINARGSRPHAFRDGRRPRATPVLGRPLRSDRVERRHVPHRGPARRPP